MSNVKLLPRRSGALPFFFEAEHGGDFASFRVDFPRAKRPWIDLRTGINPWPYPLGRIAPSAWHRLPGEAEETAVRAAAASYYGLPSADDVILAPGSQAIIQWLPRLRPRGRVIVVGPTYAEHERSWAASGHDVDMIETLEAAPANADVIVLTRPNNPDGRQTPLAALAKTAERLRRRGGWLVVDEAFADVEGGASVFASMRNEAVIALRSFGKFFGLAGGRLGAALALPPIGFRLRDALGPWAVSGPTLAVAARAYADRAWAARSRLRLARTAARLDRLATAAGLELVGGTALFRLYETPRAAEIFEVLGNAGIYVRRFAVQPRWLRFGLPADAAAEQRLKRALQAYCLGREDRR